MRKHAAELAASTPDVIAAGGAAATAPMLQATHNIPVVFTNVVDPVGAGFVETMARPREGRPACEPAKLPARSLAQPPQLPR